MTMDLIEDPYFLKNKDWYYFDTKQRKIVLTDKAPKEAVESYEKFMNEDDIYPELKEEN